MPSAEWISSGARRDLLVVLGPDGSLPPALGISPASEPQPQHWKDDMGASNAPPPPPNAAPPPLVRQNASCFSWPPDSKQEWTYIMLNPSQLSLQIKDALDMEVSEVEVAQYFRTSEEDGPLCPSAYARYAARYADEIARLVGDSSHSFHGNGSSAARLPPSTAAAAEAGDLAAASPR